LKTNKRTKNERGKKGTVEFDEISQEPCIILRLRAWTTLSFRRRTILTDVVCSEGPFFHLPIFFKK
jgi:hypothetical protein